LRWLLLLIAIRVTILNIIINILYSNQPLCSGSDTRYFTRDKLIESERGDKEMLDMISDIFKGFDEYHRAIFEMETWMKLYNHKNMPGDEYQATVAEMDGRRTSYHNSVLTSINILNRMAAQFNIPTIYNGTISEEQPYRREVADAVLGYVENIISGRR